MMVFRYCILVCMNAGPAAKSQARQSKYNLCHRSATESNLFLGPENIRRAHVLQPPMC